MQIIDNIEIVERDEIQKNKAHLLYYSRFLLMLTIFFLVCGQLVLSQSSHQYDSIASILSNKTTTFKEKYQTLSSNLNTFPIHQQISLLQKLANLSKTSGDNTNTVSIYSNLLLLYTFSEDFGLAQSYVDTVMLFSENVDDLGLAKMYYSIGVFYGQQAKMPQAHEYYYKSIDYFEKVGGQQAMQIGMLYALAVVYVSQNDTINLKKIIERMHPLVKQIDDTTSLVYYYTIIGSYFGILSNQNIESKQYRDSILFYDIRIINLYESMENPPPSYGDNIAYNYLRWANYALDDPDEDQNKIRDRIETARKIANPDDLGFTIGYHLTSARYYLIIKALQSSINEAETALKLLSHMDKEEYYSKYIQVYQILSESYAANGNFSRALEYERLKSEYQERLYNQESNQTIQELQTRYEVAKKEENIQRLTERNRYQERIRYLTLGILGLTLLVAILGFLWFRRKRKSDADALKIAKLQQQDAELKAEMEAAKLEEKEREFDALSSDMEMRQIKSYLDGLEAERTRLAGELHDNVSNALLGVEFKMRTPGASQEEITGMLHGIHEHVRNISHELMPPVFQYATLAEIIADYVYMQNGMSGPRFECHIEPEDGWEDLPQETALELHRIVQEACGNALKHSGASLISITLQRNGDHVTLTVKDNGRGMDVDSKKSGLGLQIIRDRAVKMNGSTEVTSIPGKGTTIMVTV